MTTSGEMTRQFAEALVMSHAQVAARYRALRECNLVTKGGRGPFAPEMTALDAARLLIAVMGAQAIAETPAVTTILGKADCVICEGEDDVLAGEIADLDFEQTLALILRACLAYRLGDPQDYERLARGVVISLSPTDLTATVTREGSVASFRPEQGKSSSCWPGVSSDRSVWDRLWLRSDRTGLQIHVSVEAPELLELAPAFGPSDADYRPTH